MEMSIDEAINHGQEQLEIFGGEHREFIETAIDTMRKYQKIEQIVNDELEDFHPLDRTPYKIALIKKEIGI